MATRTHGAAKRKATSTTPQNTTRSTKGNTARRSSSQTPVRGTVTSKRSAPGRVTKSATSAPSATSASSKTARGRHSPVGPQQRRTKPKSAAPAPAATPRQQRRSKKNVKAVRPDLRAAEQGVGSPQRRLRLALFVIGFILVGIIVRVGFIQTKGAESLQSAGASQWTRSYNLAAQRGTLFDRNGNELAMSVPAASISINPKLVVDGAAVLSDLDNLLDLSDEKVASLAGELDRVDKRGFVYVSRQIDANIGDFIRDLGHAGVNVDDESRREMPGGDTGRSVLGRTNIDG